MRGKAEKDQDEKEALKEKVLKYVLRGLSVEKACARVGVTQELIIRWSFSDRMFGHHLITAKAQFEAGLRLKEDDNTVIQARTMAKGKDGEWEDKYHLDTFAHAKKK